MGCLGANPGHTQLPMNLSTNFSTHAFNFRVEPNHPRVIFVNIDKYNTELVKAKKSY